VATPFYVTLDFVFHSGVPPLYRQANNKNPFMRPFLPVISFVVVSFLLLAAWINYSNPDFALRPLLYLVRLAAWMLGLGISTLVFLRAIMQRRLRRGGSTVLAVVAIMIFYPVDGFLAAHAEERVIQNKRANRNPHDDMGPNYLYGSFSPGAGGSSRGAMDDAEMAWSGFMNGLVMSIVWAPVVLVVSTLAYRSSTASPGIGRESF
jgi:hypothetical protein